VDQGQMNILHVPKLLRRFVPSHTASYRATEKQANDPTLE
jgi:hypothetical protein